jgi:hypothetical protein
LRADLTSPRDNGNCCECKNRSIEGRFHRITPYAAIRLRLLFVLPVFEGEHWLFEME